MKFFKNFDLENSGLINIILLPVMAAIINLLLHSEAIASQTYNHGYIGKSQFNIEEQKFALFDKNGECRYHFNDIHFHPKNFVMHGDALSKIYQDSNNNCVDKILVNSLPLVEHWSEDGSKPVYYTDDKSKFYWNSISDIPTFEEYKKLPENQKSKFFFLINGFLHFDMNAIEAVQTTIELYKDLPIVGFGEIFGEHDIMSDQMNPPSKIDSKALDKIYQLAGKNNWFVMIHNNLSHRSFKGPTKPIHQTTIEKVLKRHRNTMFILPHAGVMRNIVIDDLTKVISNMLRNNNNLYIDISFVVLENYIMADGNVSKDWIELIEKYPNRFLFGTDNLGGYKDFYDVKKYIPLLDSLKPKTAEKLARNNFEYLINRALNNKKW